MEILNRVKDVVNTFYSEIQKEGEDELKQVFLEDQALYQAVSVQGILEELLRGRIASIWSTPFYTSAHPEFYGFARFDIKRLIKEPQEHFLGTNEPVQIFKQVIIYPCSTDQTLKLRVYDW